VILDNNKIYNSSNYGSFVVVEYVNAKCVHIKFTKTGFLSTVLAQHVRSGGVKDKLYPNVCCVGYIGDGVYTARLFGKITRQYTAWKNMLKRCYDTQYQEKNSTYKGCSVVKEWHNFQNFAKWFDENYIEGYDLDKDIRVKGNKVYGPEFCVFVSHSDNTIEACARHFVFKSPDGETTHIYNLRQFCKNNKLDQGAMSKVYGGKRKSHKGWIKI